MIRLRKDDRGKPTELARIAAAAHLSPEEFRRPFESLVQSGLPPLSFTMPPR